MVNTKTNASVSDDIATSGLPKVEHYGWKVDNSPGVFRQVKKSDLLIDYRYQRENVKNHKVLQFASRWSWIACGCLTVVDRGEEGLFVVDGQHRKLAADKRSDINTLPCLVYRGLPIQQEAMTFVTMNNTRSSVDSLGRFKAKLVAGETIATGIKQMISAAGYRITNTDSDHTVRCISAIERAYMQNQEIAESAWNMSVLVSAGQAVTRDIYSGLFKLEYELQRAGAGSIWDEDTKEKLTRYGSSLLMQAINSIRGLTGKGGERIGAAAILSVINHKRSTRRIKLDNIDDFACPVKI